MLSIYSFLVSIAGFFLKIVAIFSPKMKLFVEGRKSVFETLSKNISNSDKNIWFHAASLGEFEQGLPVMEKIKAHFPNHKLIVTFFSPSGYEVRKNNTIADITIYLPLDTKQNAKYFLDSVHPELVFFIKYEFWPNYLNELKNRKINTYLISGIFRENQAFFKWYGGFYRKALHSFDYFFVQNESSKKLVLQLGFQNVSVSGDTRFDRVVSILEQDNTLDFIEEFKNNILTVVVGSSWPKDEELLVNFINQSAENVKFIIAPHNIKSNQILELQKSINKKSILFSDYSDSLQTSHEKSLVQTLHATSVQEYNVFIIDTIGILTKIYSYADIAYVGGGFGNPGVHNLLEPATFGVPVVIGPNYSHFAEAIALVNMEGCISIANQNQMSDAFKNLINNDDIRHEKGHICKTFVQMNKGATDKVVSYILNENLK